MLLKDRICVVVGVSSLRGIGFATAELFAAHGARIVAVDIAMDEKIEKEIRQTIDARLGSAADVTGIRCDITQVEDCRQLVP